VNADPVDVGRRWDVITLFPEYLAPLRLSLLGKAIERGDVTLGVHDLRQFTDDVHRTVDDTPYGGGPGMVMLAEPWARALDSLVPAPTDAVAQTPASGRSVPRLIVPSPSGAPFTQASAQRLAAEPWLMFACGRYEGIDARVLDYAAEQMPVEEVSLGDYVLAGGEVAVLVIAEAIGRLLPGVLGNSQSALDDSFSAGAEGLLEGPAYTKPASWRGHEVPAVLLSGNHGEIARWRRARSLDRTRERRPDLLGSDRALS
jgi:tRNA (guanine37-N1)-methyltransferase